MARTERKRSKLESAKHQLELAKLNVFGPRRTLYVSKVKEKYGNAKQGSQCESEVIKAAGKLCGAEADVESKESHLQVVEEERRH